MVNKEWPMDNIVLYIMAPSWNTINEADEEILSKTEIGFSDRRQFD